MTQAQITPDMTMEQILHHFPSAQRALFQRYHVGGCSSCAFQPTDTLAEVCRDHNILDVNEVISHLVRSDEIDREMQVEPRAVQEWLDAGETLRLIDVRPPEERDQPSLPQAEFLDFSNSQKYMSLPKDTRIVFLCRDGARSLDVAAYFAGHGFTEVRSMRGGIDSWRQDIDSSIPCA